MKENLEIRCGSFEIREKIRVTHIEQILNSAVWVIITGLERSHDFFSLIAHRHDICQHDIILLTRHCKTHKRVNVCRHNRPRQTFLPSVWGLAAVLGWQIYNQSWSNFSTILRWLVRKYVKKCLFCPSPNVDDASSPSATELIPLRNKHAT